MMIIQTAGIARGGMSVCLSVGVRPSVTVRYCIKTTKASVMVSSPSESQNILVSGNILEIRKGLPRERAIYETGVGKIGNFDDLMTNKPPYLRNGARYTHVFRSPPQKFE